MSLQISHIRVSACTPLKISGMYVLADEELTCPMHYQDEYIVKSVLQNLRSLELIYKPYLDHFYLVSSLPRNRSQLLAHCALSKMRLSAGHVLELGGNCAAVLDALVLCASLAKEDSHSVLLCADSFNTSYKGRSAGSVWKDGGSAIVFGHGGLHLTIESYVTGNDPSFSSLCSFVSRNGDVLLSMNTSDEFQEVDLRNELSIASDALKAVALNWSDIQGYVVVNRAEERTNELVHFLNEFNVPVYHSRACFGHRGGSDLIKNLQSALFATQWRNQTRLLLVANGLGYAWGAMLVRLDRVIKDGD